MANAHRSDKLQVKIESLPDSPGCYLMKSEGTVIYVGKAKNIKHRVRQYFQSPKRHTPKVAAMVEKVDDFDIVLVDNEIEALALECNLIKRYKPWYNILLKDDKHYPFIRIDLREPFPYPSLVRAQARDGAKYFGPFMNGTALRALMEVIRTVFPLRHCTGALSPTLKRRPCLHYALGECSGPCSGAVDEARYRETVDRLVDFLSGHDEPVIQTLTEQMNAAASALNYEAAAMYRDRIRAVAEAMQRQKVIVTDGRDMDILAVAPDEADALIERMSMRDGRMIDSTCYVIERAGDEMPGEVLAQFIAQYYHAENRPPKQIVVNVAVDDSDGLSALLGEWAGHKVVVHCPARGDKRALVRMAEKNLSDERQKRAQSQARTRGALQELQAALDLPDVPRRIEGYDISHTQGTFSVASEVVMIDGVTAKKEYRRYRIQTVEGIDDFAAMREVITRRFTHGLRDRARQQEASPSAAAEPMQGFADWPDLLLIDGGRGQLHAAQMAMQDLGVNVPAFGLAKRIDEIVRSDQEETLLLDRHSAALHLIQHLRDEAHRFAITYHRSLRGKASLSSRLDAIPGVGATRKRALLNHFENVEALWAADVAALCSVEGIGPEMAERIYAAIHAPDAPKGE